jgi:hypothetical protein
VAAMTRPLFVSDSFLRFTSIFIKTIICQCFAGKGLKRN